MNIIKNIESSSIVVQWDVVDDFLPTTYIVTWTDGRDLFNVATVEEQTSYTIIGLILNTEYIVHVTPVNSCGGGPEFSINFSLSMDTASTSNLVANPSSVTNSTTTITAMIDSMATTFSRDIGTIKSITNLDSTAAVTTVIEGSILLATIISK